MEKILFDNNNHHHDGLNITVRNGTKWKKLNVGDAIMCCEIDGKDTDFIGNVALVYCGRLNECPQQLLEEEHDPACQTFEGLKKVLSRVYNKEFDGSEVVTMIGYYLK